MKKQCLTNNFISRYLNIKQLPSVRHDIKTFSRYFQFDKHVCTVCVLDIQTVSHTFLANPLSVMHCRAKSKTNTLIGISKKLLCSRKNLSGKLPLGGGSNKKHRRWEIKSYGRELLSGLYCTLGLWRLLCLVFFWSW